MTAPTVAAPPALRVAPTADVTEIVRALGILAEPGQVFELRALGVSTPAYRAPHTESGYFNDFTKLAEAARQVSPNAKGTYITLNPLNQALLARACNRIRIVGRDEPLTGDADILSRRWLLIDADPRNPPDISATDSEKAAALKLASNIQEFLTARGWPHPVPIASGNGGHRLYRVDMPAADGGLIERILNALAFKFDNDEAHVDVKVFNPARICKLPGTPARKGDSTPDRPHRLARVLEFPTSLNPVSRELLEALAAEVPAEPTPASLPYARKNGEPFDLDVWIARHGLDLMGPHDWKGGRKWIFRVCPWNPDHANRSAFIVQYPSGKLGAGCHHNGCSDKDWHALRDVIEPGWSVKSPKPAHEPRAPSPGAQPDATPDAEPIFPLTDLGNAERLAARYGESLKYVRAWGWLVWSGARWEHDEGAASRLAKDTVRSIYAEAERGADEKERAAIATWAMRSESEARITAMLSLAESEREIDARPEVFDADPMLLNCANGTLDLRTGTLRPHNPADLLTRITGATYDPDAPCPTWLSFLDRIFAGNAAPIGFSRRGVGYSLTADTGEQCLFFCYGTGANGKSTFLETIRAALGDYAQAAEFSTFLARQGEAVRNDIARMVGTRFIAAIEAGEGRRLNETVIKALTGGDTVTARYLYKEYFEYRPAFKLWLAANHKPPIRGTDNAIWRRIRLIPFTVTIPEKERDPKLAARLRGELPGILAWAVKGCLEWQAIGLQTPAEVRDATDSYRAEQDVMAAFLDECCVVQSGAEAKAADLYATYKTWAEAGGEYVENQRAFGLRLAERGFESVKRTGGARAWRGIGLPARAAE